MSHEPSESEIEELIVCLAKKYHDFSTEQFKVEFRSTTSREATFNEIRSFQNRQMESKSIVVLLPDVFEDSGQIEPFIDDLSRSVHSIEDFVRNFQVALGRKPNFQEIRRFQINRNSILPSANMRQSILAQNEKLTNLFFEKLNEARSFSVPMNLLSSSSPSPPSSTSSASSSSESLVSSSSSTSSSSSPTSSSSSPTSSSSENSSAVIYSYFEVLLEALRNIAVQLNSIALKLEAPNPASPGSNKVSPNVSPKDNGNGNGNGNSKSNGNTNSKGKDKEEGNGKK